MDSIEPQSAERQPLLSSRGSESHHQDPSAHTYTQEDDNDNDNENDNNLDNNKMGWARKNQWIVLAVASGACAAFNGVFAKLTTTELTTGFSQGIARVLHLDSVENIIEYIVRGIFFGLNLIFNGVMWTFFTQALAKGNSTTQVSIINTSSNFMITALLGLLIFSESLPPLWWVGAGLLVVGNVIIGSKEEGSKGPVAEAAPVPSANVDGLGAYEDVPQIDGVLDDDLKDEDEDAVEDILELGTLDREH